VYSLVYDKTMLLRMMPSRHSPFYSPFLITAGFLAQEGVEVALRLPAEGESPGALLRNGDVDVTQSAVSSGWTEIEKGATEIPVHFAHINQRDGFFLVGRERDAGFEWKKLEGKTIIADHGHQPLVMLRWAAHHKGADWSRIQVINAGSPQAMEAAFRSGQADFVHLQAGVPQQLEQEGAGFVIASVGEGLKPLAFSSICASREFIQGDSFETFLRGFARIKQWVQQSPPGDVANSLTALFPALSMEALTAAVARCQKLGCWEGGVAIPPELYAEAQDAFLWAGGIQRRHSYEEVCLTPPPSV
jgi:NitT/TauT family transport system substrate-binding protein